MNVRMAATENRKPSTYELKLLQILSSPDAPPLSDTFNFRRWFSDQFIQNNEQSDFECSLEKFAIYFMYAIRWCTNVHLRSPQENPENNQSIKKDEILLLQKKLLQHITSPENLNATTTTTATCQETSVGMMQLQAFPMLGTPTGRSFTTVQPRNASTPVRKNLNHPYQQQQQQHYHQQQKHSQLHQSGPSQNQNLSQNQRRSIDNKSFGTPSNNSSFEKSRNSTGDVGSFGSNSLCLGDFLTSPTITHRHSSAHKKKLQLNTQPTTATAKSSSNKPKKRVVPICVSKSTTATNSKDKAPFGACSSFSQENNILSLSQTEIKEFNKCAIAEARQALKDDISEVSSVIKASTPRATPTKQRTSIPDLTTSMQNLDIASNRKASIEKEDSFDHIALDKIPNETAHQLRMLACIYGLFVDMNLTTNILNEISFLMNLLNAELTTNEVSPNTENSRGVNDDSFSIQLAAEDHYGIGDGVGVGLLKDVFNSILFAISALEDQQQALSLIDIKSLGVILQCERLLYLSPKLRNILTSIYAQKQSFPAITIYDITITGFRNVCFQEDSDSRKYFQSNNEFAAFKTQRDLFYNALKFWEKHHLYPTFIFAVEVAPKVRDIFRQSENPLNMTHFAKLFVSQLLNSATEQTSPEEVGIGMDDVNLEKFNKLSQRLIAPSEFSVDFQFPREQAFFRDFIIESRSLPFIEHLKLILFSELIKFNDSTFEHINILAEDGYRECNEQSEEYIVRPPLLGSMLILAKFLGFVTSLPYQGSTGTADSQQLRLRKLFQSPIDICEIIETAISNGRHLVTLPWIVQYLFMLDDITLQLDCFMEATKKLFAFYESLGYGEEKIAPTSAFIVRCCLGWLFENHSSFIFDYFNYRTEFQDYLRRRDIVKVPLEKTIEFQLNPLLDATMSVACPFLAEFRVSIMPPKHAMAKYVSRTGRFRHITPCLAIDPTRSGESNQQLRLSSLSGMNVNVSDILNKSYPGPKTRQKILMESFLHAQNTSMRRLIAFLTERLYKCVVKDAQTQILLPLKADADRQASQIASFDKNDVFEQLRIIYQKARNEALREWDAKVPDMINKRIKSCLEPLLPNETAPSIKKAYAWRIRCDAKLKISQWQHTNMYKNDYFCNDLNDTAGRICKTNIMNRSKVTQTGHRTEIKLIKSQPKISDIIEELQHWLYTTGFKTSFQPEIWSSLDGGQSGSGTGTVKEQSSCDKHDTALIVFLERLKTSFENTLPTIYYRLIGAGLIQILQHLITLSPLSMTNDLIQAACGFFVNNQIRDADVVTPSVKEMKSRTSMEDLRIRELSFLTSSTTSMYHALITAPFIVSLGTCGVRFEKLKDLLIALIQSKVFSLEFVNELFVAVFKEELSSGVMKNISNMLYDIAQTSSTLIKDNEKSSTTENDSEEDGFKSKLLMEVLADFSRDIDDY